MVEQNFFIHQIPAVLYGPESDRLFLFVHGKCGCKEEGREFAQIACGFGWQVLAVDLPEHGSRKSEQSTFDPWHAVPELQAVLAYGRTRWKRIALRATSIGAWFSMLAFAGEHLEKCLLVSPVLDMALLIVRMMEWAGVTEDVLQSSGTVETSFGETLSWAYYQYAKSHPVENWASPTAILYAGLDNLTPRQEVLDFAQKFQCDLTVLEDGEHWFHTPEQLQYLRRWEMLRTAPEPSAPEVLFFANKPGALTLYEALRAELVARVGEVSVKVSKTQITFSGKYGFAFVSHPRRKKDPGILVSFGLSHQQVSERIICASEPYPNRWTHHVPVKTMQEIDGELMDWLLEASQFANTK